MLILSQNGKALYDTASGTAITVEMTSVDSVWVIRGADGSNLGTYDSEESAIKKLLVFGLRSDVVRM